MGQHVHSGAFGVFNSEFSSDLLNQPFSLDPALDISFSPVHLDVIL